MKTPNSLLSRVLPFSPMTRLLLPNVSLRFPISRAHSSLSSSSKPAPFPCSTISPNPNHALFFPYAIIDQATRKAIDDNDGVTDDPDIIVFRLVLDTLLVLARILVGLLSCVAFVFRRRETIPFSKRRHSVVMRGVWAKRLDEIQFNLLNYQDVILPDTHPVTIRVRAIFKKLIVGFEKHLDELDHNEAISKPSKVLETVYNVFRGAVSIEKNKKKKEGAHLEWEILVVDQPKVNAFCLIGGKILVFTELLDHLKTDAEIATIIGHELGHAVARHNAEVLTDYTWLKIVRINLVVRGFLMLVDGIDKGRNAKLVKGLWSLSSFVEHYLSQRREFEADYIGILLMALAGYDPMVAPEVYKKLGDIYGESTEDEYLTTHPSCKTRAAKLCQAEVLEEALLIYQAVKQEQ